VKTRVFYSGIKKQNYFSVLDEDLAGSLAGVFVSFAGWLVSLVSDVELFSVWLLAGRLVDDDERWSVT
jgi:hypothetical protein